MNHQLLDKARRIAALYTYYEIRSDTTTDGEPIYLATSPDIEGCMAQGETPEQALENLKLARIDYIYSLLEDDLPLPDPIILATASTGTSVINFETTIQDKHAITYQVHYVSA